MCIHNNALIYQRNIVNEAFMPLYVEKIINSYPQVLQKVAYFLWNDISQVVSTGLCYYFGRLACKLCMQRFSFAVPLSLATPVTVAVMITLCHLSSNIVEVSSYTFVIVLNTFIDLWMCCLVYCIVIKLSCLLSSDCAILFTVMWLCSLFIILWLFCLVYCLVILVSCVLSYDWGVLLVVI